MLAACSKNIKCVAASDGSNAGQIYCPHAHLDPKTGKCSTSQNHWHIMFDQSNNPTNKVSFKCGDKQHCQLAGNPDLSEQTHNVGGCCSDPVVVNMVKMVQGLCANNACV